jgi:hypothetical protein
MTLRPIEAGNREAGHSRPTGALVLEDATCRLGTGTGGPAPAIHGNQVT